MYDYKSEMNSIVDQLSNMLAISSAIKEIKDNKSKYPEFDFWVPGYDAEGWAEKAINDYSRVVGDSLGNVSIVFKLVVMRHYRKLSQMYRKAGKGHLIDSDEFAEDLAFTIQKLHPQWFKKEV
jgi:hypothetical protein